MLKYDNHVVFDLHRSVDRIAHRQNQLPFFQNHFKLDSVQLFARFNRIVQQIRQQRDQIFFWHGKF